MYVNISTDLSDINQIDKVLKASFSQVSLKRMDTLHGGLDLSFIYDNKKITKALDFTYTDIDNVLKFTSEMLLKEQS